MDPQDPRLDQALLVDSHNGGSRGEMRSATPVWASAPQASPLSSRRAAWARAARRRVQQPRDLRLERAAAEPPAELRELAYYIDTSHGTHPTLDTFKQQTGIQVNYKPVINDNQAFSAKISPELQQDKPTGWDIIVITNGAQLSELIDNDWLIPLDMSLLPNFTKYASDSIKNPSYDPGNKFSVTWQSGFTGIAYSPQATQALGREPTSLNDLWEPALAGHVGMMSDNTELGSIGLLKLGIEPSTSTPDDWNKAAEVLQQQQKDGIPLGYYDQGYVNKLENGDTWLTQAWSGDIFLANESGYPELKFVVPDEGVMFWHDNMLIPAGAADPLDAITYMNYVYEPQVAAALASYIWYVTPVPDAKRSSRPFRAVPQSPRARSCSRIRRCTRRRTSTTCTRGHRT